MAIIRKNLSDILASRPLIDKNKITKTSENDIAHQKEMDGFAQEPSGNWQLVNSKSLTVKTKLNRQKNSSVALAS